MKKVKVALYKNGEEIKSKIVRIVDVHKTRVSMMPFMYSTDSYWVKVTG
jgi:hypothetical protein